MLVRRKTVEHPFGTLKSWMGSTHFLTKTLEKVRTEMSLHVLAYNLKRMIQILGVGPSDGGHQGLITPSCGVATASGWSAAELAVQSVSPIQPGAHVLPRPRSNLAIRITPRSGRAERRVRLVLPLAACLERGGDLLAPYIATWPFAHAQAAMRQPSPTFRSAAVKIAPDWRTCRPRSLKLIVAGETT